MFESAEGWYLRIQIVLSTLCYWNVPKKYNKSFTPPYIPKSYLIYRNFRGKITPQNIDHYLKGIAWTTNIFKNLIISGYSIFSLFTSCHWLFQIDQQKLTISNLQNAFVTVKQELENIKQKSDENVSWTARWFGYSNSKPQNNNESVHDVW